MITKVRNLFKWRLRLIQKGYDLGWEHGHEAGMVESHNQIVDLLSKHIEDIDWLKEEPFLIREIIPLVKSHNVKEVELVGWEK